MHRGLQMLLFEYAVIANHKCSRARTRTHAQTSANPKRLAPACRPLCAGVANSVKRMVSNMTMEDASLYTIGLYRDVWIAAIASSRKSLATQTAAICVRFQGRRVRRVYVTMHITFLTRKSALIYRRGLRQRVASLTLDCNGVFAIRAYSFRLNMAISRRRRRCHFHYNVF